LDIGLYGLPFGGLSTFRKGVVFMSKFERLSILIQVIRILVDLLSLRKRRRK